MNIGDSGVLGTIARLARELNFPTIRVESSSGATIRLLSTEDAYLYAIRTFTIQDLVELYVALDRVKASRAASDADTAAKGAKEPDMAEITILESIWTIARELNFPRVVFECDPGQLYIVESGEIAYLWALRDLDARDLQQLLVVLRTHRLPKVAPGIAIADAKIVGADFTALPMVTQQRLQLCVRQLVEVAKFSESTGCAVPDCKSEANYLGMPAQYVRLCWGHYSERRKE